MPETVRPRHVEAVSTLDGRTLSYTLRESRRARRPSLWMDPAAGLVVTVPVGSGADEATAFLRQHQRWVLRWIARLERRWWSGHDQDGRGMPGAESARRERPTRWPYGECLLYRGEPMTVRIIPGRAGKVERVGSELVVATRTPGIEGARRVLTRWMKAQALQTLMERTQLFSTMMGLSPARIYARALKRAWGRCWSSGSLSFNFHLIMAPSEVLDYVVVHELAHLSIRNHSPRFWSLVAVYHPEFKARRAWLRAHGPWLAL